MRRRLLWSGGRSLLAVMYGKCLLAADWVGRSEQQIEAELAKLGGRGLSITNLSFLLIRPSCCLKISMLHQLF